MSTIFGSSANKLLHRGVVLGGIAEDDCNTAWR
jgi:hypothetical protein